MMCFTFPAAAQAVATMIAPSLCLLHKRDRCMCRLFALMLGLNGNRSSQVAHLSSPRLSLVWAKFHMWETVLCAFLLVLVMCSFSWNRLIFLQMAFLRRSLISCFLSLFQLWQSLPSPPAYGLCRQSEICSLKRNKVSLGVKINKCRTEILHFFMSEYLA